MGAIVIAAALALNGAMGLFGNLFGNKPSLSRRQRGLGSRSAHRDRLEVLSRSSRKDLLDGLLETLITEREARPNPADLSLFS